ncbi:MAG: Uma2 family endonuclease [Ignavibacteria bacterium]|nr:Uma2 family endonuclease [Ignavibacteria bacterium]
MTTKDKNYISPEEYLKIERASEIKHEYFNGEIFAMSGASLKHNIITANLLIDLGNKLKNSECIPFGSDMRVYVSENGLYLILTYLFLREIKLQDDEQDTALFPKVIIEVLSKATQDYDRGGKFKLCREIATLEDYVLVSQDSVSVEHYHKQSDGRWILEEINDFVSKIKLNSIKAEIELKEIYSNIKF